MVMVGVTGEPARPTRGLARGLDWVALGRSGRVAWGRCQGSAAEPYRVVVSAVRPTVTTCTCPSRRRPCKHARGLAELVADGHLAITEEPDWVARIADALPFSERPDAPGETAAGREGPTDPEGAAKRAAARRAKVDAGLEELRVWLCDQVRTGLAGLPRAGYGHFDAIAARMVDAQAPGVASALRALPADLVSADWPTRALHAFGGLFLLAQAHARLDELPTDLAATVRSRVGYQVSKEQVRDLPPVRDRWWALAGVDTVEFQLTSRRVWLRGLDSGRWAMWLTFAPTGRELDSTIRPGLVYDCDLRGYPGSGQFRALIEPPLPDPELPREDPVAAESETVRRSWCGDDLIAVRGQFAALLVDDPWATRLPVVLCGVPVPPPVRGGPWLLRDATGASVPLVGLEADPWPLVAQSGGEPLQVMGEFDGHALEPLAVLSDALGRRYSTVVAG